MQIYWSPETGGFYNDNDHAGVLPADAVGPIDPDHHRALILGAASDYPILPGPDGLPMLGEYSPATPSTVPALKALLCLEKRGKAEAYDAWAYDPARTFRERAFIYKATDWPTDDPAFVAMTAAVGLQGAELRAFIFEAVAK